MYYVSPVCAVQVTAVIYAKRHQKKNIVTKGYGIVRKHRDFGFCAFFRSGTAMFVKNYLSFLLPLHKKQKKRSTQLTKFLKYGILSKKSLHRFKA